MVYAFTGVAQCHAPGRVVYGDCAVHGAAAIRQISDYGRCYESPNCLVRGVVA